MPLFIFISGYFSRKKERKDLWSSIWKLLEPLIVFHSIAMLLKLLFKGHISLINILTPWWVLWYLLSLIYWRLLLQIIPNKIIKNTKLILIITFSISILAGFLPFDRVLSIQRTFSFMPFFFMGYCMKGKTIFLPKKYKPLSVLFLISVVVFLLFFSRYLGSLMHSDQYAKIYGPIQRIIVFCLSIPMSLAFINVCPNKPWIARQGKLTMQYYIYHAFIIPPLMLVNKFLNIPNSFFSATIYILIIIIGIDIVLHLPFFDKFTNPSMFLRRYNKRGCLSK